MEGEEWTLGPPVVVVAPVAVGDEEDSRIGGGGEDVSGGGVSGSGGGGGGGGGNSKAGGEWSAISSTSLIPSSSAIIASVTSASAAAVNDGLCALRTAAASAISTPITAACPTTSLSFAVCPFARRKLSYRDTLRVIWYTWTLWWHLDGRVSEAKRFAAAGGCSLPPAPSGGVATHPLTLPSGSEGHTGGGNGDGSGGSVAVASPGQPPPSAHAAHAVPPSSSMPSLMPFGLALSSESPSFMAFSSSAPAHSSTTSAPPHPFTSIFSSTSTPFLNPQAPPSGFNVLCGGPSASGGVVSVGGGGGLSGGGSSGSSGGGGGGRSGGDAGGGSTSATGGYAHPPSAPFNSLSFTTSTACPRNPLASPGTPSNLPLLDPHPWGVSGLAVTPGVPLSDALYLALFNLTGAPLPFKSALAGCTALAPSPAPAGVAAARSGGISRNSAFGNDGSGSRVVKDTSGAAGKAGGHGGNDGTDMPSFMALRALDASHAPPAVVELRAALADAISRYASCPDVELFGRCLDPSRGDALPPGAFVGYVTHLLAVRRAVIAHLSAYDATGSSSSSSPPAGSPFAATTTAATAGSVAAVAGESGMASAVDINNSSNSGGGAGRSLKVPGTGNASSSLSVGHCSTVSAAAAVATAVMVDSGSDAVHDACLLAVSAATIGDCLGLGPSGLSVSAASAYPPLLTVLSPPAAVSSSSGVAVGVTGKRGVGRGASKRSDAQPIPHPQLFGGGWGEGVDVSTDAQAAGGSGGGTSSNGGDVPPRSLLSLVAAVSSPVPSSVPSAAGSTLAALMLSLTSGLTGWGGIPRGPSLVHPAGYGAGYGPHLAALSRSSPLAAVGVGSALTRAGLPVLLERSMFPSAIHAAALAAPLSPFASQSATTSGAVVTSSTTTAAAAVGGAAGIPFNMAPLAAIAAALPRPLIRFDATSAPGYDGSSADASVVEGVFGGAGALAAPAHTIDTPTPHLPVPYGPYHGASIGGIAHGIDNVYNGGSGGQGGGLVGLGSGAMASGGRGGSVRPTVTSSRPSTLTIKRKVAMDIVRAIFSHVPEIDRLALCAALATNASSSPDSAFSPHAAASAAAAAAAQGGAFTSGAAGAVQRGAVGAQLLTNPQPVVYATHILSSVIDGPTLVTNASNPHSGVGAAGGGTGGGNAVKSGGGESAGGGTKSQGGRADGRRGAEVVVAVSDMLPLVFGPLVLETAAVYALGTDALPGWRRWLYNLGDAPPQLQVASIAGGGALVWPSSPALHALEALVAKL